jgi:polysaccharide biosynthesis transport protein
MNNQLTTSTVDLLPPSNRFLATSQLHSRLHRYQLLIAKFWWVLLLIFAVVLIPIYLVSAGSPATFKSKAKMWLTGKLNLSEGRIYNEELVNFMGTQTELLRSQVIKQRALSKLESTNVPLPVAEKGITSWLPRARRGALNVWGALSPSSRAPKAERVDGFPFRLEVREAPKSSILELEVIGGEPDSTRAFLNALMAEYLEFKKEIRARTSDRALLSVSDQVAQLAKELEAQQEKMHAFQMSNNVVFIQEQGNSAASYLALVNKQLADLRTELQLLRMLQPEQLMEIGAKAKNVPANQALPMEASAKELVANLAGSQADLFRAKQQINLLKFKRDELSQFLRPTHPKIVKLNENIALQEKVAQTSRDESVKQLSERRQAVELEIKSLETSSAEWDVKAIDASRKMADYERMRHGLSRLQAAYDRLLGLIQTVDVSKTLDQENVSIMEPAAEAFPVKRMFRNLLLGTGGALFLCVGFLWAVGAFDDRFASISELRNHFSEPIVGQIPEIPLRRPKGKLEIEALEKNRFEFLESFRSIRSSLLFMGNGKPRPRTILIASAVPKEGKSTVATYLAATMAMGGSRVLLIDADMRRPSLHKNFGSSVKPGLAEILSQETDAGAVITAPVANLSFLPAGEPKRNPGELVLSPHWEPFLERIVPRFDFVLIDSPPILATDDASSLAPKVDGVLMVVRGSFTSAQIAREALDSFYQRKATVLGLIFNRAVGTAYVNYRYNQYKHDYQWRPPTDKRGPRITSEPPTVTRNS